MVVNLHRMCQKAQLKAKSKPAPQIIISRKKSDWP